MQITYGLFFFYCFLAAVGGCIVGALAIAMFSGSQVASLQAQLKQKAEFWCNDCHHYKQLTSKTALLVDREAYIKMLEERVDRLQRSNSQLGAAVQRRTWRKVQV